MCLVADAGVDVVDVVDVDVVVVIVASEGRRVDSMQQLRRPRPTDLDNLIVRMELPFACGWRRTSGINSGPSSLVSRLPQ